MTILAFSIAPWPIVGVRVALVVIGIIAWFATQALLGKRVPKVAHEVPLTDGIHVLTARFHHRYATNVAAGNRLLIASSIVIDLLGYYLLGSAIFGESIRPYVGLVMVFVLRQICQMLCPLPAPSGMVWRYPGVPAILVTYGTANDLFFSGHTAIAVYGAATLAPGHWGRVGIGGRPGDRVLRSHHRLDPPRALHDGRLHRNRLRPVGLFAQRHDRAVGGWGDSALGGVNQHPLAPTD